MASRELDPVRVVITDPAVPRSGTLTHDGVALAHGDHVLYAPNPPEPGGGPYVVAAGPWPRRADWDAEAEMLPASWLTVLDGATEGVAGSTWYFANPTALALGSLGTVVQNWLQRSRGFVLKSGEGVRIVGGAVELRDVEVDPGRYTGATQLLDQKGRVREVTPGAVQPSFIEELRLRWLSASSLEVGVGAAWVGDAVEGSVLSVGLPIPKSGLVLAANTRYYVYLWSNAGTPDVDISTQTPTAYFGSAAYKGAPAGGSVDPSHRLIGEFTTDASAGIAPGSVISAATADYSLVGYFSAFRATDQTGVASATPTKVLYSATETAHPWFVESGANLGRYTPQRAGIYDFRAAAVIAAPAVDQTRVILWLYKNGAAHKRIDTLHTSGTTNQAAFVSGSTWAQANGTTDFYEVFLQHNYGSNQTISGSAEATWFQGMLARPL